METPPSISNRFPFGLAHVRWAYYPKPTHIQSYFFHIFVKTIIMKDYNSIPFKNKSIDRLTKNTTIVPGTQNNGTQIQEVKVTPNPKDVSWEKSMNPRGVAYPLYPTKIAQRDQSNDKLVDSRPYKETGAYKDLKAAKKSQIKSKIKNNMNNIGGGLFGAGFLGTYFGSMMKDKHSGKYSQNF